jgi:hypothetical protein
MRTKSFIFLMLLLVMSFFPACDSTILTQSSLHVEDMRAMGFVGDYYLFVTIRCGSGTIANQIYNLDLYYKGNYRSSAKISYSQLDIDTLGARSAKFPLTRDEHERFYWLAYNQKNNGMPSLSELFTVKIYPDKPVTPSTPSFPTSTPAVLVDTIDLGKMSDPAPNPKGTTDVITKGFDGKYAWVKVSNISKECRYRAVYIMKTNSSTGFTKVGGGDESGYDINLLKEGETFFDEQDTSAALDKNCQIILYVYSK